MIETLKELWAAFDWKTKLFVVAIPIALLVYASTSFAPASCDHQRGVLASVDKSDNPYRANQVASWRAAVRECEAGLAARQRQATAKLADPYWVKQRADASGFYSGIWAIGLFILLPLGVVLSFAAAAGRWGNAGYVKWTDFYGIPLAMLLAVWSLFHGAGAAALMESGAVTSQAVQAFLIFTIILALALGLPVMVLLARPLLGELWSMTKGLFMLAHYMFTRHPAEVHLPSHPDIAISRPALRDAITTHYADGARSAGGFWSFIKPRFMYEHELLRAAKVEEILRADTAILQAAIKRERTRATAADLRQAATP